MFSIRYQFGFSFSEKLSIRSNNGQKEKAEMGESRSPGEKTAEFGWALIPLYVAKSVWENLSCKELCM